MAKTIKPEKNTTALLGLYLAAPMHNVLHLHVFVFHDVMHNVFVHIVKFASRPSYCTLSLIMYHPDQ